MRNIKTILLFNDLYFGILIEARSGFHLGHHTLFIMQTARHLLRDFRKKKEEDKKEGEPLRILALHTCALEPVSMLVTALEAVDMVVT
jgi:hypothetical protein